VREESREKREREKREGQGDEETRGEICMCVDVCCPAPVLPTSTSTGQPSLSPPLARSTLLPSPSPPAKTNKQPPLPLERRREDRMDGWKNPLLFL